MTGNQEVTIRPLLCAVGVPDFTGVEDIFRMTVGPQENLPSSGSMRVLRANCVPVQELRQASAQILATSAGQLIPFRCPARAR